MKHPGTAFGTRRWVDRIRPAVLARDGHACVACGATTNLQVDHIIERHDGGTDDPANLQTLCAPCHARKSAHNSNRTHRREEQGGRPPARHVSAGQSRSLVSDGAPARSVLSLPRATSTEPLTGDEPAGLPRFFPDPHPDRAGSKGGELQAYATDVIGEPLRPWQAQIADRLLEYDAAGRWCWKRSLLLVPRRCGKSTLLRVLAEWRASNGGAVIATSAKLSTVAELMLPTQQRLRDVDGYSVKYQKEQPEVNWPQRSHKNSGAYRWIGQAANQMLGRGFGADLAIVDEVQDVDMEAMEALAPSLASSPNGHVVMCGTAPRGPSELLTSYRDAAMKGKGGARIAHFEWSAPPGSDYRDEEVWRNAQPWWDISKLESIRSDVIVHGENYIRSEYLCQPVFGGDEPWLSLARWESARRPLTVPDRVQVAAVEDGRGGSGASVALAWSDGPQVCVTAIPCTGLAQAWEWAGRAEKVRCGITLRNEPQARLLAARPAGRNETALALPELRRLLEHGLCWDGDALAEQMRLVKIKEDATGSLIVQPRPPSGLVRTAAWAVMDTRTRMDPVLV